MIPSEVAYFDGKRVILVSSKGKVLSSRVVKKDQTPGYIDSDGTVHLRTNVSFEVTPGGEKYNYAADEAYQSSNDVLYSNGIATFAGSEAPVGIGIGRFGGFAVSSDGEHVAAIFAPEEKVLLKVSHLRHDYREGSDWVWEGPYEIPGWSGGPGAHPLPRFNDLRYSSSHSVIFLGVMSPMPKAFDPKTLDMRNTPLDGPLTKQSKTAEIDLLTCDTQTRLVRPLARFSVAASQEAGMGFATGRFTLSPDLKWIYIRLGACIYRLVNPDAANEKKT